MINVIFFPATIQSNTIFFCITSDELNLILKLKSSYTYCAKFRFSISQRDLFIRGKITRYTSQVSLLTQKRPVNLKYFSNKLWSRIVAGFKKSAGDRTAYSPTRLSIQRWITQERFLEILSLGPCRRRLSLFYIYSPCSFRINISWRKIYVLFWSFYSICSFPLLPSICFSSRKIYPSRDKFIYLFKYTISDISNWWKLIINLLRVIQ